MGWGTILAPILQAQRQTVLSATWGHLAPGKNVKYHYKILYANSAFSTNAGVMDMEFTKDLDSSPWLFDAMNEYMRTFKFEEKDYGLYLIEGTFRNYKWTGTAKLVYKAFS